MIEPKAPDRGRHPPTPCASGIPYARAWNIALRTGHIAVIAVLVGGHAFDVPADRLYGLLWAAIVTGAGLIVLEAYSVGLRWLAEGRGVMVLAKLVLLLLVPLAWPRRLPILIAVIVLASVGSHMPARFRYYSIVSR